MKHYYLSYFAQAYGQGDYSDCDYNDQISCTTSGSGSSSNGGGSNGGNLADTGTLLVVIVTAACLLLFAGLVIRFWRRPAEKPHDNLAGDNVEDIRR